MNEFAVAGSSGEARAANTDSIAVDRLGNSHLYIVGTDMSRADLARTIKSYVSISVDVDGHIDFESEVEPQHADQMTDVLLLMLLKTREARKRS